MRPLASTPRGKRFPQSILFLRPSFAITIDLSSLSTGRDRGSKSCLSVRVTPRLESAVAAVPAPAAFAGVDL